MSETALERSFLTRWDQLTRDLDPCPPTPTQQVLFHPERDWRWDVAWVDQLTCLDLQGGGWLRGAHHRELGSAEDCRKAAAATVMGWRVFHATTSMVSDDPASIIDPILTVLAQPVVAPNAGVAMWTARVRCLTQVGMKAESDGITVERFPGNEFLISSAFTRVAAGGKKLALAGAQRETIDLILILLQRQRQRQRGMMPKIIPFPHAMMKST